MSPNQVVFWFVIGAWTFAWLSIKGSHIINRRPLSDGPSLIPLLIVVPLPSILLGCGLNMLYPPYGTIAIIAVYIGFVLFAFCAMWFSEMRRQG